MAIPYYDLGSVSVIENGNTLTFTGAILIGNASDGDLIVIDGVASTVLLDVTDATHAEVPSWQGGAKTNAPYKIYRTSSRRFDDVQIADDLKTQVAALNTEGYYHYVAPQYGDPDAAGIKSDEGQYAFQALTGKLWVMASGVWSYLGLYKGFRPRGSYDAGAAYLANDIVSSAGSSYLVLAPTTGNAPPNVTYYEVLAAKGDTGATGATGAPGADGVDGKSYGGTSTTSLTIGLGSQTFTTQAGLAYLPDLRVRVAIGANYMEGQVTAYDPTTGVMAVNVTRVAGAGTFAAWNIGLAGDPGLGDVLAANQGSEFNPEAFRANIGVPGRNYIVNSAMMVSQQNGSTPSTAVGYYPVDQFAYVGAHDGVVSVARVASLTPKGSPNRIRATVSTADTSIGAAQYRPCCSSERRGVHSE